MNKTFGVTTEIGGLNSEYYFSKVPNLQGNSSQ